MKTKCTLIAGLVLGSALLIGCEERPEARPAPDRNITTTPSTTTPPMRDTTPTTPGTTTPGTLGSAQDMERAQSLIQEVRDHMADQDYQAAEESLRDLEQMRTRLPRDMQQQIDQLRTTLRQYLPTTQPATVPPAGG